MENLERSALLADLYQLTMAYAYWREDRHHQQAVFAMHFRRPPFAGGYAIACGLAPLIDYLGGYRFSTGDLAYLARLSGNDGRPLFDQGFLAYLRDMRLELDIDAVLEGTVVFPHEPLVRVRGPILQCQLLETVILNLINFETLIATKAARMCQAARGDEVLEFGMRRAQGVDGALAASRACFIGGCHATSNLLAGRLHGIPVRGTHAHSWVMSHSDELEAFRAYARAMPNNCVFLVDTYDTLKGVENAIAVGHELRRSGHELVGIRLDSGDLAWLSIEARKRLDAAGFPRAVIVASNDLDERLITSLKEQGATIALWGVGTRLVTGHEQPALGGVYKLSAIREGEVWRHCLKLSEQPSKVSNPGILQVRRHIADGEFVGDVVFDELIGIDPAPIMVDPFDATRRRSFAATLAHVDLLEPVMREGRLLLQAPPPGVSRARAQDQLRHLHAGIRRFDHPHQYPVGLEERLHARKQELMLASRRTSGRT